MTYKIKGKRLIGITKKEDYYEDVKGNTYSYDGKKVKKLENATDVYETLMKRKSFRESTPMTRELKLRRALKRRGL